MAVIHDSQGRGIDTLNPLFVKIQGKRNVTVQTHNSISIALSGQSASATWIDCDGFNDISYTCLNDASTSSSVDIWWSNDGVSMHGDDRGVSSTERYKTGNMPVKARYMKLAVNNVDSALSHVVSAWVYLKA